MGAYFNQNAHNNPRDHFVGTMKPTGEQYTGMAVNDYHDALDLKQVVSYHDACMCFVVVWGMHALKPLLTGSVPEICEWYKKTRCRRNLTVAATHHDIKSSVTCSWTGTCDMNCTILTNRYCLICNSGCVFVESQSVGGHLLRTTAEGVKDVNLRDQTSALLGACQLDLNLHTAVQPYAVSL